MSINMPRTAAHSVHSATLADVLERVLDKGFCLFTPLHMRAHVPVFPCEAVMVGGLSAG